MIRKILFAILLVVISVAIWLQSRPGPVQDPVAITQDHKVDELEQLADIADEISDPDGTQPTRNVTWAKKFTRVPANNKRAEISGRKANTNLKSETKQVIESALAGNTEDAISVSRLTRECAGRQQKSAQQTRIDLDKANSGNSGQVYAIAFGYPGYRFFRTREAYEEFVWELFDQCAAIGDLFNSDLRSRILKLAESGQPSARYLYALWPPAVKNFYSPDAAEMLARFEYENRALKYTWQNIDEGHTLGLIALGLSYSSSSKRLFSPTNHLQGAALLLTANKCDPGNKWLSGQFVNMNEISTTDSDNLQRDYLSAVSEELMGIFCK